MSLPEPIKVSGLREFRQALRTMDGQSQKQLRVVLNESARTVAQGASRRVPSRTGRARASLREQSSQTEARVMGGSKKVPYYGWLDFGGRIGRDRSQRRPYVSGGRYLYPAFAANRESIYRALQAGLTDLARRAGLEVSADGR